MVRIEQRVVDTYYARLYICKVCSWGVIWPFNLINLFISLISREELLSMEQISILMLDLLMQSTWLWDAMWVKFSLFHFLHKWFIYQILAMKVPIFVHRSIVLNDAVQLSTGLKNSAASVVFSAAKQYKWAHLQVITVELRFCFNISGFRVDSAREDMMGEELTLVTKMMTAVEDERYSDAGKSFCCSWICHLSLYSVLLFWLIQQGSGISSHNWGRETGKRFKVRKWME